MNILRKRHMSGYSQKWRYRMSKAFEGLKKKIEQKDFPTFREAKWKINVSYVRAEITQEEYTELRILLNRVYD